MRTLFLLLLVAQLSFLKADCAPSLWSAADPGFRVVDVTSANNLLWVCGTDESIAVSKDEGRTWQTKHRLTNGSLLLTIHFANDRFGFAAGTRGQMLFTEDGGETWSLRTEGAESILQISFADARHGIIRTQTSLLFTGDGGTTWTPVTVQDSKKLKKFPYTQSLVALDSLHMGIFLKEGAAQYYAQTILITSDGGKSWTFADIPNSTLYSFLSNLGQYWVVGTEVIHKDKPGGGYAVPVALSSPDGLVWTHSTADLTLCKMETCGACTQRGCLASNGLLSYFFDGHTKNESFAVAHDLTTKWAATDSTFCYVGSTMQCTRLVPNEKPELGGPVPAVLLPPALGMAPGKAKGPRCIFCNLDPVLVDEHIQGTYHLKVSLLIAKNGTVESATVDGAPSKEVQAQVEQRMRSWLFEPYLNDGVPVALRLNTNLDQQVIQSK